MMKRNQGFLSFVGLMFRHANGDHQSYEKTSKLQRSDLCTKREIRTVELAVKRGLIEILATDYLLLTSKGIEYCRHHGIPIR